MLKTEPKLYVPLFINNVKMNVQMKYEYLYIILTSNTFENAIMI